MQIKFLTEYYLRGRKIRIKLCISYVLQYTCTFIQWTLVNAIPPKMYLRLIKKDSFPPMFFYLQFMLKTTYNKYYSSDNANSSSHNDPAESKLVLYIMQRCICTFTQWTLVNVTPLKMYVRLMRTNCFLHVFLFAIHVKYNT